MKKLYILAALVLCLAALVGCGCKHQWADADCDTPKTCTACGETEGEALGHLWEDANCTQAKTCTDCGATEGGALGHTWRVATCEAPKTCSVCGETEGDVAAHTWVDATCTQGQTCTACGVMEGEPIAHTWVDATTEAPKTCSVCGLTEGERILTDSRFTTAAASDFIGTWEADVALPTSLMFPGSGEEDTMTLTVYLEMSNDGHLGMSLGIKDNDAFIDAILPAATAGLYAEMEAQGYDAAATNALIQSSYNMSVEDYMRLSLESMDISAVLDAAFATQMPDYVYYVADERIYLAEDWDAEFDPSTYALKDGTLEIHKLSYSMGMDCVFTRAEG